MATLNLQSFTTLVNNSAAAAQASCSQLVDFTVGSVSRAIIEANATIALWLQWLILQVLALTRAATSSGTNLDTWMADFSFTRLAATYATGTVTLGRYTTGALLTVAAGGQVKSSDGTQAFTILADPSNTTGFWNSTAGLYQITGSTATMNVLVQAVNAGTQGNVLAAAISLLASSIPGVDYCTNASAFINGLNAESDSAFRARFALYLASLQSGTVAAITYAAQSVQQGLYVAVAENVPQIGWFTVTVDNGTGTPPGSLLTAVANAVALVRPVSSTAVVQGPTVVNASININLITAAGVNHASAVAAVNAAVTPYVDSLGVGATLSYGLLWNLVAGAYAGIVAGTTISINSGTADVTATSTQVIRVSSLTVA